MKLFRLGKPRVDAPRPIKAILDSKDSAFNLLTTFNTAKRYGIVFLVGFKMSSDKTQLQRKLFVAFMS